MPAFCGGCGTAVEDDSKYCAKCGAPTGQTERVASSTSPLAAPPPAPKGMSAVAKLGIAAVVIIFVGGGVAVAGMYYAAHRVSEKSHDAVSGRVDAAAPSQKTSSSPNSLGNVCRYLRKEDVSTAIGVEVVRVEPVDDGCNFYAQGDQAEMTAKHMSAMMAAKGADAQTQKMIQGITGALGKSFQSNKQDAGDGSGTVIVFNFSIDTNGVEQMNLNRNAMQRVGDATVQDMPGIGDEAFVTGDGIIIARKGDKLIRVMYMTCPCSTQAVEPLVQKLAAAF